MRRSSQFSPCFSLASLTFCSLASIASCSVKTWLQEGNILPQLESVRPASRWHRKQSRVRDSKEAKKFPRAPPAVDMTSWVNSNRTKRVLFVFRSLAFERVGGSWEHWLRRSDEPLHCESDRFTQITDGVLQAATCRRRWRHELRLWTGSCALDIVRKQLRFKIGNLI